MNRQKDIGLPLSALGKSLHTLLTDKSATTPQTTLQSLSDACRIPICRIWDIFHNETRIRRGFIINALSTQMRNSITVTIPDNFLFKENLTDIN